MENYLSGRNPDGDPSMGKEDEPFRSYTDPGKGNAAHSHPFSTPSDDETIQTLHDEPGGPKVELVSSDNRITRIVIHLENGKVLNLHCEY
jgi:hypothetical protein